MAMTSLDERLLVEAHNGGDLDAFASIVNEYSPSLYAHAMMRLGEPRAAEDAVQETFLKFYRTIAGFEGHSSVGTWLCRIVINVCYDMSRKRQREGSGREEPLEERLAKGDQVALRVMLEDALRRVQLRQRMVFLLFEVEGLRHSEIASILEIPEGTSKAWLFEAKKELKRLLEATQ